MNFIFPRDLLPSLLQQQTSTSTQTQRTKKPWTTDPISIASIWISVKISGFAGLYDLSLSHVEFQKEDTEEGGGTQHSFKNIARACCSHLPEQQVWTVKQEGLPGRDFDSSRPSVGYLAALHEWCLVSCGDICLVWILAGYQFNSRFYLCWVLW